MAAVLSLAASIIAVVGAAETIGKTLSKVKLLRNAPDGLLALNNEVTDLTVTLRTVESYLTSSDVERTTLPQDVLEQVSSLVDRAKDRLLQLDHLIHYRFLQSESFETNYKAFRLRWIRAKDSVENHRRALLEIRQNILLQALIINSSQQSRIRLIVDEVFIVTKQIQSSQLQSNDDALRRLNEHSKLLTNITKEYAQVQNVLQSRMPSEIEHTQLNSILESEHPNSPSARSIIGIRIHVPPCQKPRCLSSCDCKCHKPHFFRSPPWFDNIIGGLVVGYSGFPCAFYQRCSSVSCTAQGHLKIKICYFFPSYFAKRMLDLFYANTASQGPQICLTVRGVFRDYSDMARCIDSDDGDTLQALFDSNRARPNDVDQRIGRTALRRAFESQRFRVCKVLLDAGADPHLRTDVSYSAFQFAWNLIYRKAFDQKTRDKLREIIPDANNDYLEECDFSPLHKVVLGIKSSTLEKELTGKDMDINARDSAGRTALNWAVQRKDIGAVSLLLRAGADPNICTTSSPLHFAAWNTDIRCVKLLLVAGAIPSYRDHYGHSALSYTSMKATNVEIFEVLLSTGISIREQDCWGNTLCIQAATYDNIYGLKILLDRGATVDEQNTEGFTALTMACFYKHNVSLRYLLRRGADCTVFDHTNNTIHHAALSGDVETLNILRDANLARIDPHKLNKNGKSAFQLVQARGSKPDGFIELLLTLIWEIRNRNDFLVGHHRYNDETLQNGINLDQNGGNIERPSVSVPSRTIHPIPASLSQGISPKPRYTLLLHYNTMATVVLELEYFIEVTLIIVLLLLGPTVLAYVFLGVGTDFFAFWE